VFSLELSDLDPSSISKQVRKQMDFFSLELNDIQNLSQFVPSVELGFNYATLLKNSNSDSNLSLHVPFFFESELQPLKQIEALSDYLAIAPSYQEEGTTNSLVGDNFIINAEAVNFSFSETQSLESPLSIAIEVATNRLSELLKDPEFSAKMQTAFGEAGTTETARNLVTQLASSQAWPTIEILSNSELKSALGAFAASTQTIYLSSDFLAQTANNPDAIARVLLEELGHYLDAKLNFIDSSGDEGAIFAALGLKNSLSEEELTVLKTENDFQQLTHNTQRFWVEQAADLAIESVSINANPPTWGQEITFDWTLANLGSTAIKFWQFELYLSSESGDSRQRFYSTPVQTYLPDGTIINRPQILPGTTYSNSIKVQLPSYSVTWKDRPILFAYARYLGVGLGDNDVNESNNIRTLARLDLPDLLITNVNAFKSDTTSGETITVNWTVTNQGSATAVGKWNDSITLSADDKLDFNSFRDYVLARPEAPANRIPLAPGASYSVSQSYNLPSNNQSYNYLFLNTNSSGIQPEKALNNNLVRILLTAEDPSQNPYNFEDNACALSDPLKSNVELHSGAVTETHSLPTYQSLGKTRGVTLRYDSLSADPRHVIHFDYANVPATTFTNSQNLLVAKLRLQANGFNYQVPGFVGTQYGLTGGENFWSTPNSTSSSPNRVSASLLADMRQAPSGRYEYIINRSIQPFNPTAPSFSSSPVSEAGKLVVVNSINSNFGSGWELVGLQRITVNSDGSALLLDGDGTVIVFEPPTTPGGAYVSPTDDFSTLERLPNGTFRRTLTDKTVYLFNAQNLLEQVIDSNGNVTRHVFDNAGRIQQIIDPTGLITTFTYTGDKVTQIADPAGRITRLGYDAAGNLTSITNPDETIRGFEYDRDRHMIAEIDERGIREEASYDWAGRATQAVKADGKVIKVAPVSVKGLYRPEQTLNPFNAPVAFSPSAEEAVAPEAVYTDENGNLFQARLDQEGHLVSSILGGEPWISQTRCDCNLIKKSVDARGNLTSYTHDAAGNTTSITSAGGTSRFSYDPVFSQLTSFTDELGKQVINSIDPNNGNLLSLTEVIGTVGGADDLVTRFTYTAQGLVDLMQDARGQLMDYDYDSFGRLISLTSAVGTPEQATVRFGYDLAGNQTLFIDENGNATEFKYDFLNRLISVIEADPDGIGPVTSPVTNFTYDAAGNPITLKDARGNTTRYEYDALNRMVKEIDALSQVTLYNYDGAGNLISLTDPLNRRTQYRYDNRDRLFETIDPEGYSTRYSYDFDNNLTSVIDPLGNKTTYFYDERDRVIRSTDAVGLSTIYRYDLANNLTASIDRNNNLTQFLYDDLNRSIGSIERSPYGYPNPLLGAIAIFMSSLARFRY
jgi:YD repeat-containing protein